MCSPFASSGAPTRVYNLPSPLPCQESVIRSGPLTIKTPNDKVFVTSAALVWKEVCWSNATYYFFGAHVCNPACAVSSISRDQALDMYHNFCDADGHIKFDHTHGKRPSCIYSWPKTHYEKSIICHRESGSVAHHNHGRSTSSLEDEDNYIYKFLFF